MEPLDERVVAIRGAEWAVGREHAELRPVEGAGLLVSDSGGGPHRFGAKEEMARWAAAEITDFGGHAIAHTGCATSSADANDVTRTRTTTFASDSGYIR